MKNFINIADIDKKDLRGIIDHAKSQKEKRSSLKKSAIDFSGRFSRQNINYDF